MSKNVAVFVDVANIFYAAKAAGVDIDYVTLLKASSAGRDLVRAYAYTGLDPDNENQRNFHEFLRRHGYKVVSKDIRKYGDGKVKANLDIELVVDMMKTARNLDIAIVVSGDGDFAPAIRAVQEMGVRVEVVSFRGNTSSDLMDVADLFTDITQIAKVEKGSSRSGRRVAGDDEDLSMTEVPDKQSEGTGDGRRRGRTRRPAEPAPVAAATRTRTSRAAPAASAGDVPIVVLPGEKLSKIAAAAPAVAARADDELDEAAADAADDEAADAMAAASGEGLDMSEEGQRRRRRRRGGRGRGRGRARDDAAPEGTPERAVELGSDDEQEDEQAPEVPARPARRPAASTFGSVWDSQIGIPAAATGGTRPPATDDEEDYDEPPIPEYLIAERRQRDAGRSGGRGASRGRGGAYAAAMDRERFGGGRGSTISRFSESAPRRDAPNRSDRPADRPSFRPAPRPAPRVSGDEPWSEVPPEIEAMLRAQLGGGQPGRPAPRRDDRPARPPMPAPAADTDDEMAEPIAATPATAAAPKARATRRPAAAKVTASGAEPEAVEAPKRRTRTTPTTKATSTAEKPARASRTTRKPATGAGDDAAEATASAPEAGAAAPKRRVTRKKADASA